MGADSPRGSDDSAGSDVARELRLRAALLSNLSHELKTPLHTMLALISVLRSEVDGPLNPEQKRQLSLVTNHGEHLLSVLASIFDLEALGHSDRARVYTRFAPLALIESICETHRTLAAEQGIEFEFIHRDLPAECTHDRLVITHLLNQLLSNALKFSSAGQTVRMNVSGAQGLAIEVVDNGIGIPPELQELVLEDFVQGEFDEKRRYAGAGVGLALVHRAVESYGGEMALSSSPGQGTCVSVLLPWLEEQRKRRVLIVDDEQGIRDSLQQVFEAKHFEVRVAQNGAEGLRAFPEFEPDLVILDLRMPEMNGYQFMAALRAEEWGSAVPIIVISAYNSAEERVKGFEAGATDFVVKPFEFEELYARINKILGIQRLESKT